jgi:hypothetical protein
VLGGSSTATLGNGLEDMFLERAKMDTKLL